MSDAVDQTTSEMQRPAKRAQPWHGVTPKAVITGLVLVVLLGIAIPWNDWSLDNTQLYNNYLPPIVTVAVLLMVLVVNPLLRQRRFVRAELVVIAVMLLGLGGVVSGGLVRGLPTFMTGPSRHLATIPSLSVLKMPLSAEQQQRAEVVARERIGRELAAYDTDGDGQCSRAEYPQPFTADKIDSDGDGVLSVEETFAYRVALDDRIVPDWRWPMPIAMSMGVPEAGSIDLHDPEYRYVIDGYLDGLPESQRVTHRSRVTWRNMETGEQATQLALSGAVRDEFRERGEPFLDLDDSMVGSQLHHRLVGERVTLTDGRQIEVAHIAAPVIPWYAWWPKLLAWAPLLVGSFVVMIATAGAVRHQWLHNERLPYPIAAVTMELMEDPQPGRRLPALFYHKSFWTAFIVVALFIGWRGLSAYRLVPLNVSNELNLTEVLKGPLLANMPWGVWVARPMLWFSIVGMTFFMSTQVSFSLWFLFIISNLVFAYMMMSGLPVEQSHFGDSTVGGFGAMVLVILWLGRKHYWQMLRAAVGLSRDEAARAAAPYLWALLIGSATMIIYMMWQGSSFTGALLLVLLFIGSLLVISRIVAESGMPMVQSAMQRRIDPVLFGMWGVGVSPVTLLPLAIIGLALGGDNRESLMPYATNASAMGDQAGIKPKRLSLVMLGATVVGCAVACLAMIWAGYRGGGGTVDPWAMNVLPIQAYDPMVKVAEAASTPERLASFEEERGGRFAAYGVGAGLVGLLGWARMMFSWWPLHPIGILLMSSWCVMVTWGSFFLGWAWRVVVMRYGGTALYRKLKPVAIGLIAGEATAVFIFMLINLVAMSFGVDLPRFKMLPW